MLRRSLLRQSRQCTSAAFPAKPSSSFTVSSPSQRPQLYNLSTRLPAPTRARILTRWYSDAAAEKKADDTAAGDQSATQAADGASAHAEEIAKKEKEIIDLKDKYLRSVADFRNLQERTKREQQAAKDFALQKFARDLIESIDNLDLALTNVPADKLTETSKETEDNDVHKDLRQLHGGLKMTESVLMNTLKKHGLERFDPSVEGEVFDPNLHEATFQAPQPDKKDGTVFYTTQKGYSLNGRILRAAKVGVVKNS